MIVMSGSGAKYSSVVAFVAPKSVKKLLVYSR